MRSECRGAIDPFPAFSSALNAVRTNADFLGAARKILDGCCRLVGAESGSMEIFSAKHAGDAIRFPKPGGLTPDVHADLPRSLLKLREQVCREKRTAFANDTSLTSEDASQTDTLRNVLLAPIVLEDTVEGLIVLANKPGAFSNEDALFAAGFGNLAALALEKSRHAEEKKLSNGALRESEERYRLLFENQPAGFALHELIFDGKGRPRDYRFLEVNPAFEALTGLRAEEIVGRTVLEMIPGLEPFWIETYGRIVLTGKPERFEQFNKTLDKYYDVLAYRPRAGHFAVLFTDITERKRTEDALRRSESRFRMIVDHINDAFYIHDFQGNIIDFNENACRMLGYTREELQGGSLRLFDSPENAVLMPERMSRLIQDGSLSFDGEHVRKDGTRVAVTVSARIVSTEGNGIVQSFVRDITERIRLQEQLAQAQKMESIGRLAGGVAHDFNNLLAVILGYGEMIASALPEGSPLSDQMSEILSAGERARDLTQQLLAFSRKQVLEMRTVELSSIVLGLKRMLQRLIGEDVDLQVIANPEPGFVKADTPQLEQVLMNLCINARDAMPRGGKLVIETSNVFLDEHYTKTHAGVTPGPYVVLSVSDTGQGMDEATQRRIFEPFFTTKEKGKGTGLGLSTVFGIVKQHGGDVWSYSEAGHGSTFKIYLPQVDPDFSPLSPKGNEVPVRGMGETILVLEDEKDVRRLICRMLTNLNYVVLEARTIEECFELAKTTENIDLLLTDVILPESDGKRVRDRMVEMRPTIKTLFMSGYTENVIAHHGVLDAGIHFIPKPFTEVALSRKVREALGGCQQET